MATKLKAAQIAETREALLLLQGGNCGLCKLPVEQDDVVHCDHDHKTGAIRGALHRACNMTLGVIEGFKGNTLKDRRAFLRGAADYLELHAVDQTGLIHPSHKTPIEKKTLAAKRRKRKART